MEIDQNTTVQVITTTRIISYGLISAIAGSIFTLLGICVKSYFEARENKKIRFFEARKKAYASLMGHLNNSFAKYNFSPKNKSLEDKLNALTQYSVNIDYELADALLFSSRKVKNKLEIYKQKILKLKGNVLSDHHNIKLPETFQIRDQEITAIQNLSKEIIDMLRQELEIK
ncbi:hypothetical protein KAJ61_06080 [Candidatus Parcubacteria bacterium]|nr:hypothetical protein [Candidatus Parcubacteria bacterium]